MYKSPIEIAIINDILGDSTINIYQIIDKYRAL